MISKIDLSAILFSRLRAAFQYLFPRRAYRRLTSQLWREEELEMSLLPALVDPEREAIDVGANVGHYSLALSKISGRVYAFEPHPRLAYILKRCLPPAVDVRQKAVSDRSGKAVLTIPFFDRPVEGMAALKPDSAIFAAARWLGRVSVPCVMLDDPSDRNVGFIKIDVEGHELEVLCGARNLIRRQRPVVLVEVEERHRSGAVEAIFEYFSDIKYNWIFAHFDSILSIAEFNHRCRT